MCGRYSLTNPAKIKDICPWLEFIPQTSSRLNIAPSEMVLMVPSHDASRMVFAQWGLTVDWQDQRCGEAVISRRPTRLINARAETVLQKPTFAGLFRRQRCLIPADGFYEWPHPPVPADDAKKPAPILFARPDRRPFCFAGLFGGDLGGKTQPAQCVILTTAAGKLVRSVHDRMPVIVPDDKLQFYLQSDCGDPNLHRLLRADLPADMRMQPENPATRLQT